MRFLYVDGCGVMGLIYEDLHRLLLFFRFSVSGLGFRNPFLLFGFWVAVIIRLAQRVKTCSQRVTEQPSCHRGRKNDEYYSLGFLNISEFRAVLPYITAASVSMVIIVATTGGRTPARTSPREFCWTLSGLGFRV